MGLNNPGGYKGAKVDPCPIINGGFETGDLTGWTAVGTVNILSGGCFSGNYCCELDSAPFTTAHITHQLLTCVSDKTFHMEYRTEPNARFYDVWLFDANWNGFTSQPSQQAAWTAWEHAIPISCTVLPIFVRIFAKDWLGIPTKMYVDNIYVY